MIEASQVAESSQTFGLDFSRAQTLGALRARLQRSLYVLHSYADIAQAIEAHAQGLKKMGHLDFAEENLMRALLQQQSREINAHTQRFDGLLQSCSFVAQMVSPCVTGLMSNNSQLPSSFSFYLLVIMAISTISSHQWPKASTQPIARVKISCP